MKDRHLSKKVNDAGLSEKLEGQTPTATLPLEVLSETLAEVRNMAEIEGWTEQEALRIIFSYGLGFLKGEEAAYDMERAGLKTDKEKIDYLLRELVRVEGRYAAMKFKAFGLERDNQTLELKLKGTVAQRDALEKMIKQLQQENSAF